MLQSQITLILSHLLHIKRQNGNVQLKKIESATSSISPARITSNSFILLKTIKFKTFDMGGEIARYFNSELYTLVIAFHDDEFRLCGLGLTVHECFAHNSLSSCKISQVTKHNLHHLPKHTSNVKVKM
jgi:hypothetical protein